VVGSNANGQGQTINFTQQHLRMATGVSPTVPGMNGMGRMMGVSPPGAQGPNPNTMGARMTIPPRMPQNGVGMCPLCPPLIPFAWNPVQIWNLTQFLSSGLTRWAFML
jgi:hypothetical protein